MQLLGRFLRYVLNINTIWGLMILISFVACVVQHYLPTTTRLPASSLREGENTLSLRITDADGTARSFAFALRALGAEILIAPQDREEKPDAPWLLSARRQNGWLLLRWDYPGPGQYELKLNDGAAAAGRLVTLQSLTDAAFDYAQTGFQIALGLVAAMVLFLGLMKVGEQAGIVQLAARVFRPLIRFLFPDIPQDHPANGAILMNFTTTVLGLGNAATPFGLKAMQELQRLNPYRNIASDSQVMLLGYNTAGFALLPTTLLALRKSAGCSDPFEVIGTCMLAGAVSTVTAIVMVKLLGRLPVFSLQAALEEEAREQGAAAAAAGHPGEDA